MKKPVPVMAVKKAFDLLEILHFGSPDDHGGMPLAEVARIMGMKPNSARNILKTMIFCGYVEQTSSSKYLPGPKCRQMGILNRAAGKSGADCVNAILKEMTERLGEASVFTVLVGGNRVIVGTVEANREIKIDRATIHSGSVFRTPTGRILAAFSSPAALAQIIERHGLPGDVWDGIDTVEKLDQALAKVREEGRCLTVEGEVRGFALPVYGRDGQFAGAIGCYAPAFRCPPEKQAEIVSQLKIHAVKIAAGLE